MTIEVFSTKSDPRKQRNEFEKKYTETLDGCAKIIETAMNILGEQDSEISGKLEEILKNIGSAKSQFEGYMNCPTRKENREVYVSCERAVTGPLIRSKNMVTNRARRLTELQIDCSGVLGCLFDYAMALAQVAKKWDNPGDEKCVTLYGGEKRLKIDVHSPFVAKGSMDGYFIKDADMRPLTAFNPIPRPGLEQKSDKATRRQIEFIQEILMKKPVFKVIFCEMGYTDSDGKLTKIVTKKFASNLIEYLALR